MATEKLEVIFTPIDGGSYAHASFLYTDANGKKFIAAGAPSTKEATKLAAGGARLSTSVREAEDSADAESINASPTFRTTVSTGAGAAADWAKVKDYAQAVNDKYGYHASQDSNSFVRAGLTQIGKGDISLPSGIGKSDVPGWANTLQSPVSGTLLNDIITGVGVLARPGPWSWSRQPAETPSKIGSGSSSTGAGDHSGYGTSSTNGPAGGPWTFIGSVLSDAVRLGVQGLTGATIDIPATVTDPARYNGSSTGQQSFSIPNWFGLGVSDFRIAPNQTAGMTAVSLSGRASRALFGSTSDLSSVIDSVIGTNGWKPTATAAVATFGGWNNGSISGSSSARMPWDSALSKDQQALREQALGADPSKGMLLGYNGPYPIYAWSAWQAGTYKTPTFFEKPDGSLWYEGPGLRQGKNPLGTGQVLTDGYNTFRASDMSFLGRGSVVNLSMPGGSSIVKIAEGTELQGLLKQHQDAWVAEAKRELAATLAQSQSVFAAAAAANHADAVARQAQSGWTLSAYPSPSGGGGGGGGGGSALYEYNGYLFRSGSSSPIADLWADGGGGGWNDPLVLNLKGGQVHTTDLDKAPVMFDMNGDGRKELTAWINADEGFLVVDRNGNGKIDDATEMFSQYSSKTATSGFSALGEVDGNRDGTINSRDAIWSKLKVWVDKNGDGVTQSNELYTMGQMSVTSISLGATKKNAYDNGNVIMSASTFTWADGAKGNIAEVNLASGTHGGGDRLYVSDDAVTVRKANGEAVQFLTGSNMNVDAGGSGLDVVVNQGGNNTIVAGGDNAMLIDTKGGATLMAGSAARATLISTASGTKMVGGSGIDTVIMSGSGGSFTGGGNGDSVTIAASGNAVAMDKGSVQLASGVTSATVTGSGNKISVAAGDDVTVKGDDNAITALGAGANVTVTGKRDTVSLGNGKLTIGDQSDVTLTGSGDAISIGNQSSLSLAGSGNTITGTGQGNILTASGSGNTAALRGATVNYAAGSSVQITAAGMSGNGLTVTGTANAAKLTGGRVTVSDNASGIIDGNSNTITAGARDQITLRGDSNTLTASGPGTSVQVSGTGERISLGNGTVRLAATGQASISGDNNTITGVTGSTIAFSGKGGSITADGSSIALADGSQVQVAGSNDKITLGSRSLLSVKGNSDTITATGGDNIVAISGTGDKLSMADGALALADNSQVDLTGSDNFVAAGRHVTLTATGNRDKIAGQGAGSTIKLSGSGDAVAMDGSSITLANGSQASVYGSSDTISVGAGSSVTVAGDRDTISTDTRVSRTVTETVVTKDYAGRKFTSTVTRTVTDNIATSIAVSGVGDRVTVSGTGATVSLSGQGSVASGVKAQTGSAISSAAAAPLLSEAQQLLSAAAAFSAAPSTTTNIPNAANTDDLIRLAANWH